MARKYGSTLGGQQHARAVAAGGGYPSNAAKGYTKLGGARPKIHPSSSNAKKMQFNLGSLGGLLGGGRGGAAFAEENLARQLEYDKAIWERSTPDVTGVGGTVRWDRDKNMVTSTLSEENQDIYDAMYERQKRFGAEADALGAGGWQDMQQRRFDQKRGLYAESDAQAQQLRLAREQATGASSTGRYMGARTEQDAINARNMLLEDQAFAESQGMFESAMGRQRNDISQMTNLGSIANSMVVTPTPNTLGNMSNVNTASTRWADNLAFESAKKAKGKSDFFGSLLGSLFG